MTFVEVSHDIKVVVKPVFVEDASDLIVSKYVFVYFIQIENLGEVPVKLLRRHWVISDSIGETHQVDGDGVIGRQPLIEPGKSHQYNSYSVLKSMIGTMEGHYEMQKPNGELIQVKIPKFLLRSHLLN